MPFEYQISGPARIVFLKATGPSSSGELDETVRAILADPDFKPGFNFLSDRRSVQILPPAEEVRRIVESLTRDFGRQAPFNWAVVVSSIATNGVARMAQIVADHSLVTIGVFMDIDEAQSWLTGEVNVQEPVHYETPTNT